MLITTMLPQFLCAHFLLLCVHSYCTGSMTHACIIIIVIVVVVDSHNTPAAPRSTSSLPRSTSLVSPPQSSPFSPTKFENHQIIEFNSGVVIAGIGEALSLDDTLQHSEDDFIGDPPFQETGGHGLQPSSISLPTTSVVHGGMKQTIGEYKGYTYVINRTSYITLYL